MIHKTPSKGARPPQASTSSTPTTLSTPSKATSKSTHRLLYRGALSLPDSHLLLDGLSFVASTPSTSVYGTYDGASVGIGINSPAAHLLENPLALALESMRGRPSLHLLGTEKVRDVCLDARGAVSVYIHPAAVISQIYFDSVLCLTSVTSPDGYTDEGIRVGLSDSSEPGQNDFLIYGQLAQPCPSPSASPSCSNSLSHTRILNIQAAHILPHPPTPHARSRVPRPDDPTPRKPPLRLVEADSDEFSVSSSLSFDFAAAGSSARAPSSSVSSALVTAASSSLSAKRKRDSSLSLPSSSLSAGAKRSKPNTNSKTKAKTRNGEEDAQVQRAREVMLHMPVSKQGSKGSRSGKDGVFKVPDIPRRHVSASGPASISGAGGEEDVFGGASVGVSQGKQAGSDELEKANKTVVKQAAVTLITGHGLAKSDSAFGDLFQAVYRGVCFALRSVMRTQAVRLSAVERLCDAHWRMYADGRGGGGEGTGRS